VIGDAFMGRILVVEDEKAISDIIKYNLKKENHTVEAIYDGEEGYNKAFNNEYDLILLDVMLPKMDGFTICKKLREKISTPIILLTARAEEVDKVLGLELGADDYMTKPFSMRELLARVKANIRRVEVDKEKKKESGKGAGFEVGDISIDEDKYEAYKNDKVLELTLREFELLKFLAANAGQVFTREELLEKVWGYEYYGDVRTVDVTVRRLREKVEDEPANAQYVITKRGVGYYFRGQK
jgi:two-component system response regulator VicR